MDYSLKPLYYSRYSSEISPALHGLQSWDTKCDEHIVSNNTDPGKMFANSFNGSVSISSLIAQAMTSQLNVGLGNASMIAEQTLGNNTRAVTAYLGISNRFLVDTVWTIDPKIGDIHKVVIDVGNGKILSIQRISNMQMIYP